MKKTVLFSMAVLVILSMLISACAGPATVTPTVKAPVATVQPTATPVPPTTGSFLDRALAGEFKGTKVTATGPFVDADAQKFDATMKAFEDQTGIDIQYQGSKEFEASIKAAIDSGTAPDIIDFPQPGLLASFARQGKIVDVSKFLNMDALKANYNQSWLDMAMMPGKDGNKIMAGVWERVNGKSLVWYPKKAWDKAGYKIPTTWEEMKKLMDDMVADGSTPWCVGIESGAATGWVATDWMEEIMLRTTSLENYDKWVAGTLPFTSPEVKHAAEVMTDLWQDKYVYGGRAGIVKTNFADAPLPMFDPAGAKCWMHKQGNFVTSFFPESAKPGVDYDFFYFPGLDPAYGKPVLVAGDIWAATQERPEVQAVMELFTKGEHLKEWMKLGGAIAPQKDADLAWYGSDIERGVAKIIQDATAVRFDGSDLMPGQVGAGSFWKEMTSYVAGAEDLDTALKNIDASWPGGTQPSTTSMLDRALAGEFKGTKVTATGPFVDADAQKFDATMKAFEDQTGIDIQYQGSKEFEASIKAAIDSGTAPDIIDFPQPGLLASFARQGKIVDVSKFLNMDALKANYNQSWLDMAMMPGKDGNKLMAGVWERVNGKSLVWYPKKAWDKAGYKIPTTWEEMKKLMDDMVADGSTPWCVGIESGAATGWVATDWMEEIMLRTTSLENYDKWVAGTLPFTSPEVKHAAEVMTDLWQDKYVYGGRAGIVKTNFADAPLPMFDPAGPKCWMHKQGNFVTSFFPESAKPGVDYDFFYFPGLDPAYGKPVLVAGDIWAATQERPEVQAVMELFTKGEHLKEWMKLGGAIAPQKDADLAWYGSDIERGVAKIIQDATAVRFDGSDLMPGQVGAGSFWKEMTSYVAGAENLDTALKNIAASWPK